jgi:hypothetical protein
VRFGEREQDLDAVGTRGGGEALLEDRRILDGGSVGGERQGEQQAERDGGEPRGSRRTAPARWVKP